MGLAPLLSVIIPTKNRANYAVSTIKGILCWGCRDVEFVVQDGSNTEELRLALRSIDDPRLRYFRSAPDLDMEANFSEAARNARGEYFAFIGDDDGVTEEVMDVARWARTYGVQAVYPSGTARFLWPDVASAIYGKRFSAALRIERFSGRISYPDGEQEIRKCAMSAGQDFHNLPRCYFGVVRRDCLEEVRQRCGTCFPGPTPDLAGAVAIASVANRIAEIDYPIFIQGTGARSSGGLGVAKRHVGRLEDWPHLPQWSVERWSELVPRLYLGQTIWAEDLVQSLNAMNRADLLRAFNAPLLYAMCLCFHPAYSQEVMRTFRQQWRRPETPRVRWVIRFAAGYVFGWWLRFQALVRNVGALTSLSSEIMILGLSDSEAAMRGLSDRLRGQRVSIREFLVVPDDGSDARSTSNASVSSGSQTPGTQPARE